MSQYPNRDPNDQPYGPDPYYAGRATGYGGGSQPPSGPHPNSPPPGVHPQAAFNPNTPNPLTPQPEVGPWYNPPTRNDPYAPTTPDFELASRPSAPPPRPRPESMDAAPTPPPQPSLPDAVSRPNGLNKKLIATVLALIVLIGATILAATLARHNQNAANTATSSYPFSNHLVLNDPMTDYSHAAQEGWTDDGANCFFANSTYHAVVSKAFFSSDCWAPYTSFTNFTYQIQMVFKQGGNDASGGLNFRGHIGTGQYYYVRLNPQGNYALKMATGLDNNPFLTLQQGHIPGFVANPDQPHTLGIVAKGNRISFYVDQHRVTEITDRHYTNGEIGVLTITKTRGNSAEVDYSNLKVWTL